MSTSSGLSALWKTEDWWAVWLGLGIVACAIIFFLTGSTLAPLAVSPPRDWTVVSQVTIHVTAQWIWYVVLFVVFGAVFTISTAVMGFQPRQYLPGFGVIYVVSVLILVVSQSRFFHTYSLEAPLVALILGLIIGNLGLVPRWFDSALRRSTTSRPASCSWVRRCR